MLIEDGLESLAEEECWRLLGAGGIGRLGCTIQALPVVCPVTYTVVDGTIMFRTAAGSSLAAATRQAVVAFGVDDYERSDRSGWSVLVVGHSETAQDLDATAPVAAAGLGSWADGRETDLIRITPGFVSGRRIVLPDRSDTVVGDPAAAGA